jgi:hypothetical protein
LKRKREFQGKKARSGDWGSCFWLLAITLLAFQFSNPTFDNFKKHYKPIEFKYLLPE